ncbi:hypothetical protein OJF2_20410 [Aquisphaera giovannonii]|uniref:TIGR03067 domain-containing protein n=1 Tax=Aquisphaera giovannonii TaxID=406548 RepID=A0A5B9VZW2_9BACT|nr:TIGR03067 domain-containing protein [Aquisphaera giovannonii]QEH33539.1 hypothetical protein OJF2_20410 [Aquisphaera giovannonii]
MRTTITSITIILGLTSPAVLGGEAIRGDLAQLQGRWSATTGAKKQVQVVMTIQGRDVSVAIKTPTGTDIQVTGELKLDESTSPRSLDWTKFTGPDEQPLPEVAAVYKVEGDTFTVCNGGFLGKRPREFKPGDGVFADVVVFRRLPSDKAAATPAPGENSSIATR